MAAYKLIYFHLKNKANVARILFALANQPYDDLRISIEQEWPNYKDQMPFKQVPVLEITENNGNTYQIAQSNSICRYLAYKFQLAGKNEIEMAQTDMIVEQATDLLNLLLETHKKPESEQKRKELEEALSLKVPQGLKLIQNILETNPNKSGFLVGDSLTYADVHLMNFYDWLLERKDKILEDLQALKHHDEKIRSVPKIAEHLQKDKNLRLTIYIPE